MRERLVVSDYSEFRLLNFEYLNSSMLYTILF
ncbi:MAG: hypothetical protein A4E54_02302 [Pelotomaculum sp. PtaB.Bin117]|nr:MAG: hypothetical protein A4E54_02302 [Pelotomaculum sp. PtaB.Bin117]OPY64027.1 MAG: hypothetical protein A4E56_00079 [Pelotomaculum sp. PtaU1.Bin065]